MESGLVCEGQLTNGGDVQCDTFPRVDSTECPRVFLLKTTTSQEGPSPRGTWDGIGRFEVYDLAGSIKEWCLNERETQNRCLCGGAWNEPGYKFGFTDSASPWSRAATYGFRCVEYGENAPEKLALAPLTRLPPQRHNLERQPLEVLVDRGLRFANDNVPLDAEVTQTEAPNPSPDFRHEVVRITAGYDNERFDIHLFLPRKGEPPFETVVWSPGMGVWQRVEKFPSALDAQDNQYIVPLIKSGRLVCQPIYKGTFERGTGIPVRRQFRENPIRTRADFIKTIKDLARTVDYLVTRSDVDPHRLVYFGLSLSAMQGPIGLVAVPEFDAAVLLSRGYSTAWTKLPELHGYQYVPHVKIPVLMINGEHDRLFDLESSQKPMFDDFVNDRSVHAIIPGAGHNPPPEKVFQVMDPWLKSIFSAEQTHGNDDVTQGRRKNNFTFMSPLHRPAQRE